MKQNTRPLLPINGTWSDDLPTSTIPATYEGLPDVIDDFSCGDWAVYLKRNREILGVDKAREIMLIDFGHVGIFNFDFPLCEFHCSFVNEVTLLDPNLLSALAYIACGLTDTTKDVVLAVQAVAETVKNTAETGANFSKHLLWIIPIVGITTGAYYANKYGIFEKRGAIGKYLN